MTDGTTVGHQVSGSDIEALKTAYAAFAEGDSERFLAVLDAHIEWIEPAGGEVVAGRYVGREAVERGVLAWLPRMYETFSLEPHEFLAAGGDRVIVLGTVHGRSRQGATIHSGFVHVWGMRDGRAVSFRDYHDRALRIAVLERQLTTAVSAAAEALAAALDERDGYDAGHCQRVAELAAAVADRLGLDEEQRLAIRLAAFLHDVGKIAVPDSILRKPGTLSSEEWDVIRRHSIVGADIVSGLPFADQVGAIIRHDHERWDGGGYPDGLSGEDIPLGARVVLVADAYHAMTADRPYRPRRTEAEARAELHEAAGSQFDPAVVEAGLALLREGGA